LNRAARSLLGKVDPFETRRVATITNAIHESVYDYPVPTDLKGRKVIDIRPQVRRGVRDNFTQRFSEKFDYDKALRTFSIKHNDAVKTVRISQSGNAPTVLHDCDSITANGTWAVSSDASTLTVDSIDYVSGSASLKFNLASSGSSGILENSTFTSFDLSTDQQVAEFFAWVYIPTGTGLTSVTLRVGSGSGAYWSVSATTAFDSTAFRNGWNLVKWAWADMTQTGTVDETAINYLRFAFAYNGTAQVGVRIDSIFVSRGSLYEMEYYSKFLFRSSAGTWKEEVSDLSDIVNLDTESYNLYLYEIQLCAIQQQQGENMGADLRWVNDELTKLYDQYNADNPSEWERPKSSYWEFPNDTYRIR